MKGLLIFVFSGWHAVALAGSIIEKIKEDPGAYSESVLKLHYPELLVFFRSALEESKTGNEGFLARQFLVATWGGLAREKMVNVAIDFALSGTDWEMRAMGGRVIAHSSADGLRLDEATRLRAIQKVNAIFATGIPASKEGADFAKEAIKALAFLGDEKALDIFLTDSAAVKRYQKRDGWNPSSPGQLFGELVEKYQKRAAEVTKEYPYEDLLVAKMYQFCKRRRDQGAVVAPVAPAISLDHITPQ